MIVIAYYTADDIYRPHADLLRKSLDKFNLSHDLEEIQPTSWLGATAFKPTFIKKKLIEHGKPVLYIDIDAIVLQELGRFFDAINEDLAVHISEDNELISSVIYLQYNEKVIKLLDEWIHQMSLNPTVWDQRVLQGILEQPHNMSIARIPVEYAFIFDTFKERYPNVQPIIEHLQASRETKYREKCNSFKYKLLGCFGIKPKIGRLLNNRRKRMSTLNSDLKM